MTKRAASKAAKPDSGVEKWMWPQEWPSNDWATEYCTEEADPIPDLLLGRYRRDKRGLAKHSYLQGAEEYEARSCSPTYSEVGRTLGCSIAPLTCSLI